MAVSRLMTDNQVVQHELGLIFISVLPRSHVEPRPHPSNMCADAN
jgi:hypothetical protein